MAYVALYRQWRPQNFDTLVGQQPVKTALTNALASGRIAHAYLFAGPRGTGKTSTARIFAKALNCEQGPTPAPCGHCSNCRRIAEGTSLDVLEIDAASNRGIDEIKALRDQLAYASVDCRYKVYIIDEVHMLTTEAFNALLKTLEEPPAHVIFILATTDPHKIPATIHSRCQRFDFRRVTVDEIAAQLALVAEGSGIDAEAEALQLIAVQSDGGLRDALSLLDQCTVMGKQVTAAAVRQVLGIAGREAVRALAAAIGRQDTEEALTRLTELLEQGKEVRQVLTELAEYLRALLLYQAAPGYEEIYLTDTAEELQALAPLFGRERLLAAEERLHTALQELRGTLRGRITAELCLLDLCRLEGSTLAALTARVEQLERRLAAGLPEARTSAAAAVQEPAAAAKAAVPALPEQPKPPKKAKAETAPLRQEPLPPVKPPQQAEAPQQARAKNAESSAAAETPGAEEFGGDLAAGEDLWRQTLELVQAEKKMSMHSCAKDGRVYSFAGNVLVVAFKVPFKSERMNKDDFRSYFEELLLRLARRPVRLHCASEAELGQAPALRTESVRQETAGRQAPLPQKELPEKLRRAADVLGAAVTEI